VRIKLFLKTELKLNNDMPRGGKEKAAKIAATKVQGSAEKVQRQR
jgi:hypothetical protein